jgi:hypothetical protein
MEEWKNRRKSEKITDKRLKPECSCLFINFFPQIDPFVATRLLEHSLQCQTAIIPAFTASIYST